MPVTAKLSQAFYDRFGDAVATELVDWFNAMDASVHTSIRQLSEINIDRFDAKLEQRTSVLDLKLGKLDAKIDRLDAKIDQVSAGLDAKIDQVGAGLDAKIDHVAMLLDTKIDRLDAKIDYAAATLGARIDECATKVQLEQLRGAMAELQVAVKNEIVVQFRWMIGLWFTMCVALLGLLYRR